MQNLAIVVRNPAAPVIVCNRNAVRTIALYWKIHALTHFCVSEFDPSGRRRRRYGNRARSGKIHPSPLMSCNKVCKLVYFYKMLGLAGAGKNKTYWKWSRDIYSAALLVPTSYRINSHLDFSRVCGAAPRVRLEFDENMGLRLMFIFQGSLNHGQRTGALIAMTFNNFTCRNRVERCETWNVTSHINYDAENCELLRFSSLRNGFFFFGIIHNVTIQCFASITITVTNGCCFDGEC